MSHHWTLRRSCRNCTKAACAAPQLNCFQAKTDTAPCIFVGTVGLQKTRTSLTHSESETQFTKLSLPTSDADEKKMKWMWSEMRDTCYHIEWISWPIKNLVLSQFLAWLICFLYSYRYLFSTYIYAYGALMAQWLEAPAPHRSLARYPPLANKAIDPSGKKLN